MLSGQLEIITQGQSYLNIVSTEQYTQIIKPNFMSSAGSHIRHIIDHYLAIVTGFDDDLIDYDKRARGTQVESSPILAMEQFERIANWIKQLSAEDLNKEVILSTEVSITEKSVESVKTTIARELIFAGSHAVHHFAMIGQISFAQNVLLPECFGIAPATATFLRENGAQMNHLKNAKTQTAQGKLKVVAS